MFLSLILFMRSLVAAFFHSEDVVISTKDQSINDATQLWGLPVNEECPFDALAPVDDVIFLHWARRVTILFARGTNTYNFWQE